MTDITENVISLSAEEVSNRFFKLLKSLSSTMDLTPELVSNITGLPATPVKDRKKNFNFGAAIKNDWAYGYALFYDAPLKKMALNFSFHQIKSGDRKSMESICTIDLDGFDQRLKNIDFEYIKDFRSHKLGKSYKKDELSVDVWFVGESEENNIHKCVSEISIR